MAEAQSKTVLVVSAHAGDFVWRAGGAIASYAKAGWKVRIVCLSFGERGESARLWREPGMTLDRVKQTRKEEALKCAEILGGEIEFFDCGDYPLGFTQAHLERLVDVYRAVRPAFVLTHSIEDPYNFDHPMATHAAQHARVIAQAHGHKPDQPVIGAPPVFLFEPHQPEMCQFKPNLLLDITEVWDIKRRAFEVLAAQEHLWEYYSRVALQRGAQAARNSENNKIKQAEAYQRVFPQVAQRFD